MALFNRSKKTDSDINNFYASERRRQVGIAWLLGLVTLVVTLLLAAGIYFGGRWLYRTFIDDSSEPATVQTETSTASDNGLLDTITIDDEQDETDTSDENATATETSETNDTTESNSSPDTSSSSTAIPSTGASELPSTGPSGPEELR